LISRSAIASLGLFLALAASAFGPARASRMTEVA